MKVYVLWATCGEYSDRSEWMVAAYLDETKAKTHAELANAWGRENWKGRFDRSIPECPFDKHFTGDYTGPADYSVAALDVFEDVPAYKVQA